MRMKSMLAMGFMSMMITIGVGNGSNSFAADLNRGVVPEPRMGHGGSTYSLSQADGASDCQVAGAERRKVDIIERIGAGGSTYSASPPPSVQASACQVVGRKVDVVQRIGHGGSTYSFSHPNVQTAIR